MNRPVRDILTFVIPFACVSYYPFLYLFDANASPWTIAPLAAVIPFAMLSLLTWHIGLAHYQSTGS